MPFAYVLFMFPFCVNAMGHNGNIKTLKHISGSEGEVIDHLAKLGFGRVRGTHDQCFGLG